MKKILLISCLLLVGIIQSNAQYLETMDAQTSDTYNGGGGSTSFTLTWYLDGNILHFTLSGDTGTTFNPSSDPSGRDNSVWFQLWDMAGNSYILNYEVIWDQYTFPYGTFLYSDQVDISGYPNHYQIDMTSNMSVW